MPAAGGWRPWKTESFSYGGIFILKKPKCAGTVVLELFEDFQLVIGTKCCKKCPT